MDGFLGIHELLKFTQEETDHLYGTKYLNGVESIIN